RERSLDPGGQSASEDRCEHPEQDDQCGALRRDREERDRRRGHAGVDVRRPRVERSKRDLEPETREQENDAQDEDRIVGNVPGREPREPRRAELPEEERDAEERERGGERPREEILQARLRRRRGLPEIRREDVKRERKRLEAEEDHEQIEA